MKRIGELLKDISRNPDQDIGKPEPLKCSRFVLLIQKVSLYNPTQSPTRQTLNPNFSTSSLASLPACNSGLL